MEVKLFTFLMASLITNITPKEITRDTDTNYHVASFGYYEGLKFAKDNKLLQTTNFKDVFAGTHYIVCCGDVMVKVNSTDYPKITRRPI